MRNLSLRETEKRNLSAHNLAMKCLNSVHTYSTDELFIKVRQSIRTSSVDVIENNYFGYFSLLQWGQECRNFKFCLPISNYIQF